MKVAENLHCQHQSPNQSSAFELASTDVSMETYKLENTNQNLPANLSQGGFANDIDDTTTDEAIIEMIAAARTLPTP